MNRKSSFVGALASIALVVLGCSMPNAAHAVGITYTVANESEFTWLYSYNVTNSSLSGGVAEFRIFFTLGLFDDLEFVATPSGWDSFVADPDPELPDDGFLDSLLLSGSLALGQSAGGFQVRFSWLGSGTPGSQSFVVLDPETFETLYSGRTVSADGPTPGVPEPGTAMLLATALGALGWTLRRSRGSTTG